jgi:hypothetical protein
MTFRAESSPAFVDSRLTLIFSGVLKIESKTPQQSKPARFGPVTTIMGLCESKPKVLAVVGATGMQGGGVCRAALKDGKYSVRALTRDPAKVWNNMI